jgi:predicted metalloprotease
MALWDKINTTGKVIDRRGDSTGLMAGGGLIGIVSLGIFLFSIFSGGSVDPNSLQQILTQLSQLQGTTSQVESQKFAGDDSYEVFAGKVLGSSNETWSELFYQSGKTYHEPQLVLFRQATQSGCGFTSSAVGPHYCPADKTIYLDETFFDQLTKLLGAKGGDVAQGYVIAHEVGHHVQNQLGVLGKANSDNDTSIAIELQADCYAGIWAKSVSDQGVIEPNEIDEAIDAAESVGDDRIQQTTEGSIHPESWTHGSSAQRKTWFLAGYNSGSPSSCNTFKTL